MSKASLILDMSKICLDCMFCFELDEGIKAHCSVVSGDEYEGFFRRIECDGGYCQNKPEWCPLKELPERRKYNEEFFNGDVKGWNDCLETILGENKNV